MLFNCLLYIKAFNIYAPFCHLFRKFRSGLSSLSVYDLYWPMALPVAGSQPVVGSILLFRTQFPLHTLLILLQSINFANFVCQMLNLFMLLSIVTTIYFLFQLFALLMIVDTLPVNKVFFNVHVLFFIYLHLNAIVSLQSKKLCTASEGMESMSLLFSFIRYCFLLA